LRKILSTSRLPEARLREVIPRLKRSHLRLLAALPVLAAFAGCGRPSFPAFPDGFREFAYVANRDGNTVTVLDLVYLRPDHTLSVGTAPVALAANPKRDEVYVVNSQPGQAAGSISVIDTTKNAVVATIPVGRNPSYISVDPTGQRAFVANTGSNTVSMLDLASRKVIGTGATGDKPVLALVSPDGRTVVVANRGSGSVSVFAANIPPLPAAGAVATAPAMGAALSLRATFQGCQGAADAVILPDSTKTFVACSFGHHVMSIWLAAAPDSWPAKQDAGLMKDQALALLNVGNNPTNITLKPDGGEAFVSNRDSDSISEILTTSNEVGSTYAIGNRPAHGVVSEDNSALWVSNAGGEAISLYSIADGKFLSSIRTGMTPDALAFGDPEQMLLVADKGSGDVAVIRTSSKLGPSLVEILPAGGSPVAIVVKAMPPKA
jgi:YVTN family beta-propeller protein